MKRLLHFFHPLMLSVEKVKYLSNRWHLLTEKKNQHKRLQKAGMNTRNFNRRKAQNCSQLAFAFNEYGRLNPEPGEKCLHSWSINVLQDRESSFMKLWGGGLSMRDLDNNCSLFPPAACLPF